MPGLNLIDDEERTPGIATSSGLNLAQSSSPGIGLDQAEMRREIARGESASQSGAAGETVTVPKRDWFKALTIAGLALRDIGSSLQGKPTNFLLEAMMKEEETGLKQAASQREEKRLGLAERQTKLAETSALRAERTQFLNELITFAPRLYTGTDENRLKAIGAFEQAGAKFDLVPLVKAVTGSPDMARFTGQYAPLLQKYGTEGLILTLNEMVAKGQRAEAMKFLEDQMKPFAMQEAREAVRTAVTNLTEGGTPPNYDEVLKSVKGQNPLYTRLIEQNPDFYSGEFALRGIKTPKIAEIGAEAKAREGAKAPEITPEKMLVKLAQDKFPGDPEKQRTFIIQEQAKAEQIKQEALLPGRVEVARQTGAAVEAEKETIRLGRKVPGDIQSLLGLQRGMTVRDAEAMGIKIPEGTELQKLKELKSFIQQGHSSITELDTLVAKTPEAFGATGRATALLTGLQGQAENVARLSGIRVDASLDPKDYAGTFREIGITSARMQSNIIALVFPLAVAAQGGVAGGGRLSDKDVEFQIRRIGANVQDPVMFRAVLADLQRNLDQSWRTAVETMTGRAPEGMSSEGTKISSTPQEIEAMPLAGLKSLNPKLLNAEQRKALDRALTRHGF